MNNNFLSLWLGILIAVGSSIVFLLVGNTMYFPLKVCYGVAFLVNLIVIVFNIVTIINKSAKKVS